MASIILRYCDYVLFETSLNHLMLYNGFVTPFIYEMSEKLIYASESKNQSTKVLIGLNTQDWFIFLNSTDDKDKK